MSPTATQQMSGPWGQRGVGCILRVIGTFCLVCYFEKGCYKGEITHETKNKRQS